MARFGLKQGCKAFCRPMGPFPDAGFIEERCATAGWPHCIPFGGWAESRAPAHFLGFGWFTVMILGVVRIRKESRVQIATMAPVFLPV
jgi:hypothetical protein